MSRDSQDLDDLGGRPGYELKRASVALHHAMEQALEPHGLTVARYACLEILARNPGASGAELARGAFVSRQAAHQVVQRLLGERLVARAPDPHSARRHQLTLTSQGQTRRRNAAAAVQLVERRIRATLPDGTDRQLVAQLKAITDALTTARHD